MIKLFDWWAALTWSKAAFVVGCFICTCWFLYLIVVVRVVKEVTLGKPHHSTERPKTQAVP